MAYLILLSDMQHLAVCEKDKEMGCGVKVFYQNFLRPPADGLENSEKALYQNIKFLQIRQKKPKTGLTIYLISGCSSPAK